MVTTYKRSLFYGSLLIKAVLVSSIILSTLLMLKSVDDMDDARHLNEVAHTIKLTLLDAETGQRGYILTGDSRYLEPFNSAQQNLVPQIRIFNGLMVKRDASVTADDMVDMAVSKMKELAVSIHMRDTVGFEAAQEVVENYSGKSLMDDIRVIMDKTLQDSSARISNLMAHIHMLSDIIVFIALSLPLFVLLTFYSIGLVKGFDHSQFR